jgi:carboxyl-terminal processing protease
MKRLLLAALISLLSLAPAFSQPAPRKGVPKIPSLDELINGAPNKGQDVPPAPDAQPGIVIELEPGQSLGIDMADLAAIEMLATKIKNEYVDGAKFSSKDLYYAAAKGMFKQLDPHSTFYTPDEFKKFQAALSGTSSGIGAIMNTEKKKGEGAVVKLPIPGAPAQKAGVQPGDVVTEVNGQSTLQMTIEEVVDKIKGQEGTPVTLKIDRPNPADPKAPKKLSFTITRAAFQTANIYSELLPNNVGYVYFNEFRDQSTEYAFLQHVTKLVAAGAKSLIIDVRNNPGGSLGTVIRISALFLKKGQIIVKMKDSKGAEKVEKAPADGPFTGLAVKMLINGGSASASEILAGALKDHGRAKLYGAQSYGKGSAQVVIGLSDGAGIKLTVNKWFTPNGASIDRVDGSGGGVAPDVKIDVSPEVEGKALVRIFQKMSGLPLDPAGNIADPALEAALK